jgi:hypothetical protein
MQGQRVSQGVDGAPGGACGPEVPGLGRGVGGRVGAVVVDDYTGWL